MDFCSLEQTTAPKNPTPVKHTFPFAISLSLLLSLFAGTSAHGQCAQLSTLSSAQTIAADAPLASPEPLREKTVGQWIAGGRVLRTQRWDHPSFKLRVGRAFTISVPKN